MSEQVVLLHVLTGMLCLVVRYSGLLSALTGFVAAGLLAWPALSELRDRRQWESLSAAHRRAEIKAKNAADPIPAKINQIQWDFLERRMGQFYSQRGFVLGGFALLVISFGLTVVEKLTAGPG